MRCRHTRACFSRRSPSAAVRWRPRSICDASGVARDRQSLVVMLRSSHLIRSSGSSDRVETYHDRIREALSARVAPDAAARHPWPDRGLAGRAAERRLRSVVRTLSRRRRRPNERPCRRACAADKAAAALAFDRAASFYQHALDLGSGAERRPGGGKAAGRCARQRRPARRGRRSLPARRRWTPNAPVRSSCSARRRTVSRRRAHRSGTRSARQRAQRASA